jgi:hypothetical protein
MDDGRKVDTGTTGALKAAVTRSMFMGEKRRMEKDLS